MNRIKSWIRAFFGFSRNETNAFLILLPLMFLLVFIIPTYRATMGLQKRNYVEEGKELDSLIAVWHAAEKVDSITKINSPNLFPFNPNTATVAEFTSLGFSEKLAQRIENYRSKGGKFIIKSDLLKLYGIDTSFFLRIYPFIELPENRPEFKKENLAIIEKPKKTTSEKFDLNLADTTQLIGIYGIGSKLSMRIINYRESLGGYISLNQLKEVYGLDTSVIKQLEKKSFITENFTPRTLPVNTATEKELAAHPYIRYKLAKAIAAYRFQHGNFSSLDELRNITLIDAPTFEKIKPYLSLTP
jgi:DNA uptake protein ComE-like DNA-binding protein